MRASESLERSRALQLGGEKELSDDARKLLGNLGSEVKKALAENASESVFAQVLVDGNANGAAPADAE